MRYAEVFLWGSRIGILHLEENEVFADFEYDRDFVEEIRNTGIQPSPIKMPVSTGIYRFTDIGEAFKGVPGMIADSLPDRFGNAVISSWLSAQGKSETDFNVIDRLCYTGSRGMGALEYVPATGPIEAPGEAVDVNEMVKLATDILNKRKSISFDLEKNLTYSQLLQLGTSAGGARAKAIIAWNEETNEIRSGQTEVEEGFDHWIIKLDGIGRNGDHGLEDRTEYTVIEYAYYLMARAAGIEMSECRLLQENGRNHFMTRRFDREAGRKIHMQTLAAIAHIDYNIPGLCSYEQAAMYMNEMGLGANEVEKLFRRMVFNVRAVNRDDHVKNISFLMDRRGTWKLAPAYDMTFAYNPGNRWLKAHQMRINGKTDSISIEDMKEAGINMGLSKSRINLVIEQVESAVGKWRLFAEGTGLGEPVYQAIQDVLRREAGE